MLSIRTATPADIPAIQLIADKTWWNTYSNILTDEQLRYMLNTIYSTDVLQACIQDGSQTFIILEDERGPQGFASVGSKTQQPPIWKLHKLYVLPENHGKGYGRILIDQVKKRIARPGINTLDLNVNRYNTARNFYEKIGFKIIGEEDVPVGPYFMNDYVMRLVFSI